MANNNETQSKTYKQQAGEYYNRQYDSWMPWIEDKYLAWFTKDNKASYATKRMSLLSFLRPPHPSLSLSVLPTPPTNHSLTHPPENLDKTKVTGNEQIDTAQDGVNGLVSGQMGQGGLAQPLGDAVSKEGINRAERGGKDEQGRSIEGQGPLGGYGQGAVDGVKGVFGGKK
jgi:hypothetical protein